ncbi:MAG: HIT family protein [Bacteroidia bacterium]|nr:MAG: HIT family protein [Bacteroidia bacterium]
MGCLLCENERNQIIVYNDLYRLVLVEDPYYVGYIRLIWNTHIKEMTDLSHEEAMIIFEAILQIENIMRKTLNPDKINIASLGNVVTHLHWHIIPRFCQDRHFPNSIWGEITHINYLPDLIKIQKQQEMVDRLMVLL